MNNRQILLDLTLTFMKIGGFTFGGGYAMIPLIDNECVKKKKWITRDEFMNMTIIAESTPGPIAINCAAFVGYQQAGLVGSVLATIGMVLPSFTIIYLLSSFFDNILEITVIANAFHGIRIAVGVLIVNVAAKMVLGIQKKVHPMIVFSCSFLILLLVNFLNVRFSSIYLIALSGLVGYLVHVIPKFLGKSRDVGKTI